MTENTKAGTRPTREPEFGRTASDYASHRAGFPLSFFEAAKARGFGLKDQTIVDLGTGTGTLARGFAEAGALVIGIDSDPAMLSEALTLAAGANLAIDFHQATAEATGLEPEIADLATAGQCWHWFEPRAATLEVLRILKPGGTLLIAHFDWLPLKGNVVHATEQLIVEHNPSWRGAGGLGVYPLWLHHMKSAGFTGIETFSYDEDAKYSHEGWRGRIRASAGIAALSEKARAKFDEAHTAMLTREFPAQPLITPHRVWAVFGQKSAS